MSNTTGTANLSGISAKAMLVTQIIRFKGWSAKDLEISDATAQKYNAKQGRISVSKTLIEPEMLAAMRAIKSQAYKHHLENTLPWDNWGRRLLPSDNYLEYTKAQREFAAQYEAARDEFLSHYEDFIDQADRDLGNAFKASDYPSTAELESKYVIEHTFEPIPDQDFRVSISDNEKRKLISDAKKDMQERVNTAMGDLWGRLEASLTKLTDSMERYTDPDDESAKKWRPEWLDNVQAVVDLIPKMNFTGDESLDKLVKQARETVCRFEQDELKKDPAAQQEALASAKDVMGKMEGLFGAPKEAA